MTTSPEHIKLRGTFFVAAVLAACLQVRAQNSSLYINSAGNVGIGTTNPGNYLLNVNGGNMGVFNPTNPAIAIGDASAPFYITNAGTYLNISAYDQTSGNTRISIARDGGNVGIGTMNPGAKLDIAGLTRAEGGLSLPNNSWISADDTAGHSHLIVGVYANNVIGIGDITNAFGSTELFASGQGFLWYANGNQVASMDSVGNIHANSFITPANTYADFVFKPGYKLTPLSDVEASIKKDGHLPGIPSEAEAKAHGIDLAQMQVKLLQQVEELTLHVIDQEKRLNNQARRIGQLEKENAELRTNPSFAEATEGRR